MGLTQEGQSFFGQNPLDPGTLSEIQEIRKLLQVRGIHVTPTSPLCDVCGVWIATHVKGGKFLCDYEEGEK